MSTAKKQGATITCPDVKKDEPHQGQGYKARNAGAEISFCDVVLVVLFYDAEQNKFVSLYQNLIKWKKEN